MSLTVFFALCILGMDFLIYFFFKLVYGEKRRVPPRRLPAEYYNDSSSVSGKSASSPLHLVPARKPRLSQAKRILSMPAPKIDPRGNTEVKRLPDAGMLFRNFGELLAQRRIASSLAQAKPRQ